MILNPTTGRVPGNAGIDLIVRTDLGESIQGAVDTAVDHNGEAGIFVAVTAPGHQLRRNVSGGTATHDNGGCEFDVAAGTINGPRNSANRVVVAGADGSLFPTGCLGTP